MRRTGAVTKVDSLPSVTDAAASRLTIQWPGSKNLSAQWRIAGVVKDFASDAQPFAQPITTGIIKRNARLVHLASRRLARDQDAGGAAASSRALIRGKSGFS